jgi:hypothetical protein
MNQEGPNDPFEWDEYVVAPLSEAPLALVGYDGIRTRARVPRIVSSQACTIIPSLLATNFNWFLSPLRV